MRTAQHNGSGYNWVGVARLFLDFNTPSPLPSHKLVPRTNGPIRESLEGQLIAKTNEKADSWSIHSFDQLEGCTAGVEGDGGGGGGAGERLVYTAE